MFRIVDTGHTRDCQRTTRRHFLQIGTMSLLGGLSLPSLLRARTEAQADPKAVKDRSVVFLFLQGGPSHIEFFDPKMSAPDDVRSITGEVQTALPGITFGSSFPQMGKIADKLAIVRSYASMNADHSYLSVTGGGNPLKAGMGSLYTRVAGTTHPISGIPRNVVVLPEAVDPRIKLGSNFETGALPTLTSPGELGPSYAAFDPSGGGDLKKNMQLKLSAEQFSDRRQLLGQLDKLRREVDNSGTMDSADRFQQQAFDVITRGVADAFDLSKEDPAVVARYDTSKLVNLPDVHKYYDMKRCSNLLGKQLLLARRLCEAGCGFVTVSDCGWDMHANENSPKNMALLPTMAGQVDHAVAAFVEDLEQRGLTDKILLVVTGEMGRTPRRNKNGGRDHYANLTSLALAGGGLKMGQVVGQSDRIASAPSSERYTPRELMATVLHTLLDRGEVRLQPELGKAGTAVIEGDPIPALV
jgi:hypothetical protein